LGYAHPVLKHGANNHCAYGADFWLVKSNAIPLVLCAVGPFSGTSNVKPQTRTGDIYKAEIRQAFSREISADVSIDSEVSSVSDRLIYSLRFVLSHPFARKKAKGWGTARAHIHTVRA